MQIKFYCYAMKQINNIYLKSHLSNIFNLDGDNLTQKVDENNMNMKIKHF